MGWWGAVLLAVGCLFSVNAGDPNTAFEQANRLYEEGKFRAAAEAYTRLVEAGRVSSALYFNLGNAWFKAGELGRAIFNYHLAQRLDARDPDVKANLRMAREMVSGGAVARAPAWRRWVNRLTFDEWTLLFCGVLWTCFGLLTLGELRRRPWPGLRRWVAFLAALAAVSGAGLLAAWLEREGHQVAIVTSKEAVVHYGPLEVSPQLQVVPDGTELEIVDRKDGWLQVTGLRRGTGWIQQSDVAILPP